MGMDIYGNEPRTPDGEYFRASVWSWRPLRLLIEEANQRFSLGLNLSGFDSNSGDGLAAQEECGRLADALETLLAENPREAFTLDIEPEGVEAAMLAGLSGAGWEIRAPRGPHYGIASDHVREFVSFLRACGGFKIW